MSSQFKKDDIIYFALDGIQYLAKFDSSDEGFIRVEYPISIVMTQKGLQFIPPSPIGVFSSAYFQKSKISVIALVGDDIKRSFESTLTQLRAKESNLVVPG